MTRVENREQLAALRDRLRDEVREKRATRTRVIIGMGTCGIAAGAREVMDAVRTALKNRDVAADVIPVGCIGICEMEPLVDIEEPGLSRVTYRNIQPEMVSHLVEEHLVGHRVVSEWAVGRLHPDGIDAPGAQSPRNDGAKEAGIS